MRVSLGRSAGCIIRWPGRIFPSSSPFFLFLLWCTNFFSPFGFSFSVRKLTMPGRKFIAQHFLYFFFLTPSSLLDLIQHFSGIYIIKVSVKEPVEDVFFSFFQQSGSFIREQFLATLSEEAFYPHVSTILIFIDLYARVWSVIFFSFFRSSRSSQRVIFTFIHVNRRRRWMSLSFTFNQRAFQKAKSIHQYSVFFSLSSLDVYKGCH